MEVQHFSHHHPLVFIQDHSVASKPGLCLGCEKPVEGWSYGCNQCEFYLHKGCAELELGPQIQHPFHPEHPLTLLPQSPYGGAKLVQFVLLQCAELPLEINHAYDRKHPLILLPQPPTHPRKCSCSLCKIQWSGFVYSCSLCNFHLSLADFFSQQTLTDASHEHPWMLISRKMSFICDFCGTAGEHSPCYCATCHLLDWMCRICYEEVDISYGHYRCPASRCHYIAHVCCATDKAIWDGTIMLEGYDESIGELMVASEIKHSYHDHNLRLIFSGKTKDDDSQCDGCTRPISTPFYSCKQCKFFLHKDYAELPKEMRHPFHKHLLTLPNSHNEDNISWCCACCRWYQGFSYRCYRDCSFRIDIHCMLFSDTLKHPCHEHLLFLVHNNEGTSCSACFKRLDSGAVAYRCMKRCDFNLDVGCATLPFTAWYKYDRHPLTLTYSYDSEPSRLHCDLCEKKREPYHWFYYCADCDNSLHLNCAVEDLPYMKLGNKLEFYHPHPVTVVKNIWNCPPCKVCGELCNGQALKCKEFECNFTVHWGCRWRLK
ncbi:hypothetical protein ERO13_A02G025702v2 [Gossypium hirsutum]|nr:hypothetical protein ERO13_A02G025702v2 [Gossypium hirsutum]